MRTILISGASRGIGKAIAIQALKEGNKVSLGIRDPEVLKDSILDPNISGSDRVLINTYDIFNKKSLNKWIEKTLEKFGSFDSVINSSGIFSPTRFLYDDFEENSIKELLEVNLMGPWKLIRESWDEIKKNGQGRVIVLVSMSGKRSKGSLAGYTASKFALMGLCETIRNEGWESGIRVSAICPGWVNTDMAKQVTSIKKKEMSQPEDIALITTNLLKLPNSSVPFEIKVNCNLEK